MTLDSRLRSDLWSAVRNSYESSNYSGAIQDGFYFLTSVIKDKTGLEGDGVTIVDQAFNVKDPILKVNRLTTESERNVQSGLHHLLRGLYTGIRNPRAHEKHEDPESSAEAILLFINYLLTIIDKASAPYVKDIYLGRVFDKDLPNDNRYAVLLASEIPLKNVIEVLDEIIKDPSKGNVSVSLVFKALLTRLDPELQDEIYHRLGEAIRDTSSTPTFIRYITIARNLEWERIPEIARLRAEHQVLKSIAEGRVNAADVTTGGGVATWAVNLIPRFEIKGHVTNKIVQMSVSKDSTERNYAYKYFISMLPHLEEEMSETTLEKFQEALVDGDSKLFEGIKKVRKKEWLKPLQDTIDSFKPKIVVTSDDDLPF